MPRKDIINSHLLCQKLTRVSIGVLILFASFVPSYQKIYCRCCQCHDEHQRFEKQRNIFVIAIYDKEQCEEKRKDERNCEREFSLGNSFHLFFRIHNQASKIITGHTL